MMPREQISKNHRRAIWWSKRISEFATLLGLLLSFLSLAMTIRGVDEGVGKKFGIFCIFVAGASSLSLLDKLAHWLGEPNSYPRLLGLATVTTLILVGCASAGLLVFA